MTDNKPMEPVAAITADELLEPIIENMREYCEVKIVKHETTLAECDELWPDDSSGIVYQLIDRIRRASKTIRTIAAQVESLRAENERLKSENRRAIDCVKDMLRADDGQAFKEAQRFIESLTPPQPTAKEKV